MQNVPNIWAHSNEIHSETLCVRNKICSTWCSRGIKTCWSRTKTVRWTLNESEAVRLFGSVSPRSLLHFECRTKLWHMHIYFSVLFLLENPYCYCVARDSASLYLIQIFHRNANCQHKIRFSWFRFRKGKFNNSLKTHIISVELTITTIYQKCSEQATSWRFSSYFQPNER